MRMKPCSAALGLCLLMGAVAPAPADGATFAGVDPVIPERGLESLAWLAGCWSNPRGEAGSGEYWQPPAGGTMLGLGRLVRGGRTVEYEFLRLHVDPEGRVVYTATPSGQAETSFVASAIGVGGATFENPAHDFPQRIVYIRDAAAGMTVRIEGPRQGRPHAVEFRFERAACPN